MRAIKPEQGRNAGTGFKAGATALALMAWCAGSSAAPAVSATNDVDSASVQEQFLMAPLASHRGSFFYAALGVPMLESAETLPAHTGYLRLRTDYAYSSRGPTMGNDQRRRQYVQETFRSGKTPRDIFSGLYDTWLAVEGTYGLLPWLEVGARAAYGGWYEHEDTFYLFDREGRPLVRFEDRDIKGEGASGRQDDISDAVLSAKARLLRSGDASLMNTLSVGASVKLPMAAGRNLEDAGTTDFALRLLDSLDAGPFSVHVNVAGVVPAGSQNLFIKEDDVSLDPFLAGGLGVTWRATDTLAFDVQAEGNTSAFRDVRFLDGNVLTVTAGARKLIGSYVLEAGFGKGCTEVSYDWSGFLAVGRPF